MGIGVSVFLLAVGAILTFAVEASISGVSLTAIGIILMIAGGLGLVIALVIMGRNNYGGTVVEERRVRDREVY